MMHGSEDGRIVQIAFLGGPKVEVNFAKLMMKRLTHTGSTLRARPVEFKAQIAQELQEQVWPLIEAGKVATGDACGVCVGRCGESPCADGIEAIISAKSY